MAFSTISFGSSAWSRPTKLSPTTNARANRRAFFTRYLLRCGSKLQNRRRENCETTLRMEKGGGNRKRIQLRCVLVYGRLNPAAGARVCLYQLVTTRREDRWYSQNKT